MDEQTRRIKAEKRVDTLLKTINRIDDLFEYRFKHYSVVDLKKKVLGIISDGVKEL